MHREMFIFGITQNLVAELNQSKARSAIFSISLFSLEILGKHNVYKEILN